MQGTRRSIQITSLYIDENKQIILFYQDNIFLI